MNFQFESFQAFLAMGGYGVYVWVSMAATFIALGLVAWHASFTRKKLTKEVVAQQARAARIEQAKQQSSPLS
ncbi:MAG: ABC-type heme export system membrane stabilizing component CcmD [Idiomarinaceae bacterium HL-53]|nr:MAG: ABC-type heme export system membrane stabilizing component CcmD [Idiomarinaceae bacterium HL-53]CUS47159.1 heme exporter protein D [Idiomarinaceae bacterium HL-53]